MSDFKSGPLSRTKMSRLKKQNPNQKNPQGENGGFKINLFAKSRIKSLKASQYTVRAHIFTLCSHRIETWHSTIISVCLLNSLIILSSIFFLGVYYVMRERKAS